MPRWACRDVHYFTLTSTTLKHYSSEKDFHDGKPLESFRLNPQCCVFETNLMANAFELVTGKKVLHMAGASAKISEDWIRTLRRIITQSQVTQGPLLDRVRERWGGSVDGQLAGSDFYKVRTLAVEENCTRGAPPSLRHLLLGCPSLCSPGPL